MGRKRKTTTDRRRRRPAGTHRPRGQRRLPWERLSDRALLSVRMSDLGLRIEGSWLESCVDETCAELERRGLRIRPHVWLSQEWFSPAGVPGVAIPFYRAPPRLMRLERKKMLEVEGATRDECIRILRHEYGHALQHAFRLHRRSRWRAVFGNPSKKYPEHYRPNPASRRYVQHLRLYYAQSHPVEDFAETFAVWLQGPSIWRRRYRSWPALKKLLYVDELMKELRGKVPPVRTRKVVEPIRELRMTLREYYREKQEHYTPHHPDTYDRDLRRLFSGDRKNRKAKLASVFLRENRRTIRQMVGRWTGEYEFTLDQVLNDIIARCSQLKLRVSGPERKLSFDFALLLTVHTMHFLYNRRNWIAL
jgi:hypothetical protein